MFRLTAARRGGLPRLPLPSRADSDYDVPVVLPRRLGPKARLRLATRCRQRLAQAGLDLDVLVKSPGEIRKYHDKRGRIGHEALSSAIKL